MVRYWGFYSNAARGKRRKAAAADTPQAPCRQDDELTQRARLSWAKLIRRVYEVDPLLCPFCGAEMKILAFILEFGGAQAIRKSLKLPAFSCPGPPWFLPFQSFLPYIGRGIKRKESWSRRMGGGAEYPQSPRVHGALSAQSVNRGPGDSATRDTGSPLDNGSISDNRRDPSQPICSVGHAEEPHSRYRCRRCTRINPRDGGPRLAPFHTASTHPRTRQPPDHP